MRPISYKLTTAMTGLTKLTQNSILEIKGHPKDTKKCIATLVKSGEVYKQTTKG